MAIKEQYLNKWRRLNKNSKKKVNVSDIKLVEYEHSVITKQMEETIKYLEEKFASYGKAGNKEAKWDMIKDLQYRIIVRPLPTGEYALVSGRLQHELLCRLNVQSAYVYVVETGSKQEFMDEVKRTLTITTMLPVKAIVKPSIEVTEAEINASMAYLMKNKDFEHQMVVDPFTYKVLKNPVNLYVAERIGLVDVQVKLEAKK